jgi:hypothetical protein
MRFLAWLEEYLVEERVEHAEVWSALRQERRLSRATWLRLGIVGRTRQLARGMKRLLPVPR